MGSGSSMVVVVVVVVALVVFLIMAVGVGIHLQQSPASQARLCHHHTQRLETTWLLLEIYNRILFERHHDPTHLCQTLLAYPKPRTEILFAVCGSCCTNRRSHTEDALSLWADLTERVLRASATQQVENLCR